MVVFLRGLIRARAAAACLASEGAVTTAGRFSSCAVVHLAEPGGDGEMAAGGGQGEERQRARRGIGLDWGDRGDTRDSSQTVRRASGWACPRREVSHGRDAILGNGGRIGCRIWGAGVLLLDGGVAIIRAFAPFSRKIAPTA